jgi:DNA polymerase-3 subunit gamma/tau
MAKRGSSDKPDKKPDSKPGKGKPEEAAESANAYVVFARRFRPRAFSDVVGQMPTTNALRQALNTGRLAQAYLFCGPRGVGKTSLARIVAKALNCLNGKGPNGIAEEPCNACAACESIQEGSALDVIEMDAATNRGIEEVRSLRENVGISPAELRYKVYIIDEVHMLTREAWNAFLKTLEEPPAHVKFIFATTDPNNVPETILSRCQRYDLRRIGPADIVTRLKQICALDKIQFEESALSRIASLAKGGLRDAEGLLDQAVNLGQGKVSDATVRELAGAAPDELISDILKNCAHGNSSAVLLKTHEALEAGADPEDMLSALSERLRGTLLSKVCGGDSPLLEGQAHLKSAYAELAGLLSEDQMLMLLQLFAAAHRQMRDAAQTRLPLEMALIRAARAKDLVDLGKLVSALESGATPRPPNPPNPQGREGFRPNSPGRSVDVETRPAASANPAPARPASAASAPSLPAGSNVSGEIWNRIVSGASSQKGGAVLASALSHAQAVQLNEAAGTLTLGYTADQGFYRESLEKPHNQTTLLGILKEVLGRDVKILIERCAASAARISAAPETRRAEPPRTAQPAVPQRPQTPQRPTPPPSAGDEPPEIAEDYPTEDPEVEFDEAGALPLTSRPPESTAQPVMSEEGDDAPAAGPAPFRAPVVKRPVMTPQRGASDAKEFEGHPVVKLVLKEVNGVIVGVNKKA